MKSNEIRAKLKKMTEDPRRKLLRKQFLDQVVVLGEDGFPGDEICQVGIATLLDSYAGLVGTMAAVAWIRAVIDAVEEPGQTLPPFIN